MVVSEQVSGEYPTLMWQLCCSQLPSTAGPRSNTLDAHGILQHLEALVDDRYAAVDLAVDATHRQVKRQKVAEDTYGSAVPQVGSSCSAQSLTGCQNSKQPQ